MKHLAVNEAGLLCSPTGPLVCPLFSGKEGQVYCGVRCAGFDVTPGMIQEYSQVAGAKKTACELVTCSFAHQALGLFKPEVSGSLPPQLQVQAQPT